MSLAENAQIIKQPDQPEGPEACDNRAGGIVAGENQRKPVGAKRCDEEDDAPGEIPWSHSAFG